MAFLPNSTIYLCNVPIDSEYKNQVYFKTKDEQKAYFSGKSVKLLLSYLVVRKTTPNGSFQTSIKVDMNIDDVHSLGVNYLFYQNANHGEKYFYAFVDKIIYINEGTTELVFSTDVYQTWLFDVNILPSYVVREHSATDEIGEHLIPESFTANDYKYIELLPNVEITGRDLLDDWCYLVASTESLYADTGTDDTVGNIGTVKDISGVAQGFYYFFLQSSYHIKAFMACIEEKGVDDGYIQTIVALPKFSVNLAEISDVGNDKSTLKEKDSPIKHVEGWGEIVDSDVSESVVSIRFSKDRVKFEGYTPKNNKLYTAPYFSLCVSNHNGTENNYAVENFSGQYTNEKLMTFLLTGDISPNPSIYLCPQSFMGVGTNYDYAMTLQDFPQISHNSDSYKLWLAKNQGSIALQTIGNFGNIAAGLASTVGSGGVASAIGGGQIMQGVTGLLSTFNDMYVASKMPNKVSGGGGKNLLLLSQGMNKFSYYWKIIKKDYAETIDNFFTMYGYQTNKVKQPNTNVRPYFNYVQTIDINIIGGIPSEDMEKLKNVYNSGVTLWKPHAVIGNYDVDNSPT